MIGAVERAADLAALATAHRADAGVEALYVLSGELAGEVDAVADWPWGAEGTLHIDERCFQLNPVTWAQLRRHAVTVRGERPHPLVEDAVIVSKSRAGALAAEQWPDLARPLADVLAARRGEPAAFTTRHALAAVDLGRRVLAATR